MNQEDAMPDEHLVERLDLRSADVAGARRQELLRLFPEAASEGGAIDLDQLRRSLGEVVEPGKERYGMTWPGKADCIRTIQTPTIATLLPLADESVQFDRTANVVIEGDNLEVLKLLQKSYLGQVKMIYIDPPYNTGNDFIYPDNFAESLQTYLAYSGQADTGGRKFSTNVESDGRFHSKWLTMMYSRLYLARNLLTPDGFVFISIDDHELANLITIGKEVFGEEHLVGVVTRSTGTPTGGGFDILVNLVDYIVIFAKSDEAGLQGLSMTEADAEIYDQEDERGRYLTRSLRRTGGEDRREDRPSMYYPIKGPDGVDVFPIGPTGYESRWICGPARFKELEREGLVEWKQVAGPDGQLAWRPYQRFYLDGRTKLASNLWTDVAGNKKASRALKELFGAKVFDSPKPVELVERCIAMGCDEDGLVMDFFAGSGTTAEAVMSLNSRDGGQRRFLLVQLPEPTGRDDYPTIAHILRERIRRSADKMKASPIQQVLGDPPPAVDTGFRGFRLAESNFEVWEAARAENPEALQQQLQAHIEHIRPGRSEADLLYEILLKSGFALEASTTRLDVAGAEAWSIQDGALIVCLHRNATLEQVRAIAHASPERVVMLDAAFAGNDQLKANAAQIFKSKSIVFKTV